MTQLVKRTADSTVLLIVSSYWHDNSIVFKINRPTCRSKKLAHLWHYTNSSIFDKLFTVRRQPHKMPKFISLNFDCGALEVLRRAQGRAGVLKSRDLAAKLWRANGKQALPAVTMCGWWSSSEGRTSCKSLSQRCPCHSWTRLQCPSYQNLTLLSFKCEVRPSCKRSLAGTASQ